MIALGDIYEDCAYHPVRCEAVNEDLGMVSGVSLIDGSRPRTCSLGHCGVIKLTDAEAQTRVATFKIDGDRGLLRLAGWNEAQIDDFMQKWR